MSEISVLRQQVEGLEEMIRGHLGSDWATPIGSSPHPSLPARYREIHGPTKESVATGKAMTFIVDYDQSVLVLHQAKLTIRIKPVRSNVSAAAGDSGGGATSSSSGAHNHLMMQYSATLGEGDVQRESDIPDPQSGGSLSAAEYDGHTHFYFDVEVPAQDAYKGKKSGGSDHTVLMIANTSPADIYTYDTSANHSHTVAAHTHDVTLTYGIFEGPTPTDPDVSISINGVDVTSALGGPWNADVTLDVTQYLRENSGDPLRQDNLIVLTTDELCDLEVVCKSFVSASTPLAVNVQAL